MDAGYGMGRSGILLLLVLFTGCTVDGPDVIPAKDAESELTTACLYSLVRNFPPEVYGTATTTSTTSDTAPPLDFIEESQASASYLCNYDQHRYVNDEEMVSVSSLETCKNTILAMSASSYDDFIVQYGMIRSFVCKLKTIRFLEFTEPLQGGI